MRNQALLAVQAAARYKHQLLSGALSLDGAQGCDATSTGESAGRTMLDTVPVPDPRSDAEAQLLINEQLQSVVRTFPTLTRRERRALAEALAGESYKQLATVVGGNTQGYLARRRPRAVQLAAAMPHAA